MNNNQGGYTQNFYLKNEKDSAFIRFLFDNLDDVPILSVHNVALTSKSGTTYYAQVDCLGEGCPFCKHATKTTPFSPARDMGYMPLLQIYNENGEYEPTFKVFNRSVSWMSNTLVGFESRYGLDSIIETEKTGKGTKTNYMLYPAMKGVNGQALPELPTLSKLIEDFDVTEESITNGVRSWTAEEMENYIKFGTNKSEDTDDVGDVEQTVQIRRRGF
nr:MAG TPA: DNA binding protein like protein [Caudoviricetes sp.]